MRSSFAAALLVLLAPPEFRGCSGGGSDAPDEDVPLPPGDGCVTDADCADMCMDVRCLAGACMTVGPAIDRDGDGRSPPPCGDDCDDRDPGVFNGAPEQCDGRDNDCDTTIDEGAPRLDASYPLTIGDATSIVLAWGPVFLVTEATSSVLWGVPVALDGRAGTPVEIMRLTMGTSFTRVAGAASGARVLVVAVTDFGVARWVVIERDETGNARRVMGPGTLATPTDVQSLEVLPFGAGWAIAFDGTTTFGPERLVTLDPTMEPTIRLPLATLPTRSFGFASDGTHLVLSDDAGNVVFFDPDGTEVGRHAMVGDLAARPLASRSGAVIVAKGDDFDYVLAPVDLASGVGTEQPAPFGDATDVVRIATAGDVLVVGRSDTFGTTRVQGILAADLVTYVGSGLTFGRGGDDVARLSVTASDGTVAALGALRSGSGADIGILAACAGGS